MVRMEMMREGVQCEIDIFTSATGNFNITTFEHISASVWSSSQLPALEMTGVMERREAMVKMERTEKMAQMVRMEKMEGTLTMKTRVEMTKM